MKMSPFLTHIIGDILDERLNITTRPMMGGYVIYSDGKVFAIVDNDELWFKGSKDTSNRYLARGSRKFSYTKNGNNQEMNYFSVPEEIIENRQELDDWIDMALFVAKKEKKK